MLSVGRGTPRTIAAQASGIALSTFYEWLKDEPGFRDRIIEAESRWADDLMTKAMEIVTDQPDKRISADMIKWMLERRAFQFFARKEVVKTGRGDMEDAGGLEVTAATVESVELSAARVEAIVRLLTDAGVGESDSADGSGPDAEDDKVHPSRSNGHAGSVPAGPGS